MRIYRSRSLATQEENNVPIAIGAVYGIFFLATRKHDLQPRRSEVPDRFPCRAEPCTLSIEFPDRYRLARNYAAPRQRRKEHERLPRPASSPSIEIVRKVFLDVPDLI